MSSCSSCFLLRAPRRRMTLVPPRIVTTEKTRPGSCQLTATQDASRRGVAARPRDVRNTTAAAAAAALVDHTKKRCRRAGRNNDHTSAACRPRPHEAEVARFVRERRTLQGPPAMSMCVWRRRRMQHGCCEPSSSCVDRPRARRDCQRVLRARTAVKNNRGLVRFPSGHAGLRLN